MNLNSANRVEILKLVNATLEELESVNPHSPEVTDHSDSIEIREERPGEVLVTIEDACGFPLYRRHFSTAPEARNWVRRYHDRYPSLTVDDFTK